MQDTPAKKKRKQTQVDVAKEKRQRDDVVATTQQPSRWSGELYVKTNDPCVHLVAHVEQQCTHVKTRNGNQFLQKCRTSLGADISNTYAVVHHCKLDASKEFFVRVPLLAFPAGSSVRH